MKNYDFGRFGKRLGVKLNMVISEAVVDYGVPQGLEIYRLMPYEYINKLSHRLMTGDLLLGHVSYIGLTKDEAVAAYFIVSKVLEAFRNKEVELLKKDKWDGLELEVEDFKRSIEVVLDYYDKFGTCCTVEEDEKGVITHTKEGDVSLTTTFQLMDAYEPPRDVHKKNIGY